MSKTDANDSIINFFLPEVLKAKEPPEFRGRARDDVKLMVINRESGKVTHSKFNKIGDFLRKGDLLVFNSSRTLPASLQGCTDSGGPCIEVRLAEHLQDDTWLALLLCKKGDPFDCGLKENMNIEFGEGLNALVLKKDDGIPRLWKLQFSKNGHELIDLIYRLGQPVRYEYLNAPWDLDYYQNVYANEPGSSEMPSAGRAFTWKLLFDLKKSKIEIAYITLHTGLSSYMDDKLDLKHPVSEEQYYIPGETAQKINDTRENGNRIIAIGTSVVRALESARQAGDSLIPGRNFTRLHITKEYPLRIVDGLLTGFHEPQASHLDLLTAFIKTNHIKSAYEEAITRQYHWHEFGDLNLIV